MGFLGFHHFGTFLLFVATALFIVATLSSPVYNQLSFLKASIELTSSSDITLGVLGYCTTISGSRDSCSSRSIGYSLTTIISSATGSTWSRTSLDTLTKALILNPICAGITFLAFLIAALSSRLGYLCAALIAFIAFLVSLVALAVDLVLFLAVKKHVEDNGLTAEWGVCIWLVVGAVVAVFVGAIATCFSCFTERKTKRMAPYSAQYNQMGY